WFAVNPLPAMPSSLSVAGVGGAMYTFMFFALLIVSVAVAVRNVRRRRVDFRGGSRAAIFAFGVTLASLVLGAHFTLGSIGAHISGLLPNAGLDAMVFFTTYLAPEPYVRRYWPDPLISWQRMVDGRCRDS